jgi:hypothetical protein
MKLRKHATNKLQPASHRFGKRTKLSLSKLRSRRARFRFARQDHCSSTCSPPIFHPAETLNRRPDVLTVKSSLGRPIRASCKGMKIKADVILARDSSPGLLLARIFALTQFQGEAHISTWLNSIARNCSLMLLRKRRNRPEVKIENSPDPNSNPALFDPPDSRPDQLSCVVRREIRTARQVHRGSSDHPSYDRRSHHPQWPDP